MFIHLFNKCLSNTYLVPGIVLEGGSSKTCPCPKGELTDQQGRQRWERVIVIKNDMHNSRDCSRSLALNALSIKVFF